MKIPAFQDLFPHKPFIGVIHLPALPGAPAFAGEMERVFEKAILEAELYNANGVDAIIVENFHDAPFFPHSVPPETVAAMSAVTREIVNRVQVPVGVNVLRNDAHAAMAIAAATGAQFIRVNVHISAVLADQGVIQGQAHHTLRLRQQLQTPALILADVGVKHAAPLVNRGLKYEVRDLAERGHADALIVSGSGTGHATSTDDLQTALENSGMPVLIGSGCTPEYLPDIKAASGFIVGSYLKENGKVNGALDADRIQTFLNQLNLIR